uniref:Uncharacterized protein n=1 Tax=Leviviridae sp. TaxID=2027243 RepID=A0A514D5Z4_9VIRU|nr:MAG: hypothetical protein H4Bulk47234_000002 [Leviviridae sp.]
MAFADPQSINPGSGAVSLPRTGTGPGTGEFSSADGTLLMSIRHNRGKRISSSVQVRLSKLVSDPLRPADYKPVEAFVTLAVNKPLQGFTATELLTFWNGIIANMAATTDTNTKKLLGLEN